MQQPPHHYRSADTEMAGLFPPDLHDVRHLWLKAGLLVVWALVSFIATYFARDLQFLVAGGWPLGYWIAAQGAVVVFMALVVVYGWAMNRFERQDALLKAVHEQTGREQAVRELAVDAGRAPGDRSPRNV